MTVRSVGGATPRVASSAWVSEVAYVVGDVEIGERSSIWPGTVVRGDVAPIRIGIGTHIEDNCVVHSGIPMSVGDSVLVGHSVVLHGRDVGRNCLIGNHATILDESVLGEFCLVAAGTLVLSAAEVPPGSFVFGSPSEIRPLSDRQRTMLEGLSNPTAGYNQLMETYRDAGL